MRAWNIDQLSNGQWIVASNGSVKVIELEPILDMIERIIKDTLAWSDDLSDEVMKFMRDNGRYQ